MTRQQVDKIVELLLAESRETGRRMTKEEIEKRAGGGYSKGQRERIFRRYRYLLEKQEIMLYGSIDKELS